MIIRKRVGDIKREKGVRDVKKKIWGGVREKERFEEVLERERKSLEMSRKKEDFEKIKW